MPTPVEDLAAQALGLPPEDRAKLVERLLESFEPRSHAQTAWLQLARSRRDDVRAGKVAMVPGDEGFGSGQSAHPVTYWLHPEAEAELGDAAVYYAKHANRSVAEAFLAEFERVRDLLMENQYRGPHGDFGLRFYHFDRFPYTLFYEPHDPLGPQIFAVAHQHREPGYWSSRVDG